MRFQSEAPTIEYGLLGCQGMFAYLEKHDAARNMARFYAVDVQPNLFGQWSTVRQWGRIGRGRGQSMEEWHLSAEAAAQVECAPWGGH